MYISFQEKPFQINWKIHNFWLTISQRIAAWMTLSSWFQVNKRTIFTFYIFILRSIRHRRLLLISFPCTALQQYFHWIVFAVIAMNLHMECSHAILYRISFAPIITTYEGRSDFVFVRCVNAFSAPISTIVTDNKNNNKSQSKQIVDCRRPKLDFPLFSVDINLFDFSNIAHIQWHRSAQQSTYVQRVWFCFTVIYRAQKKLLMQRQLCCVGCAILCMAHHFA